MKRSFSYTDLPSILNRSTRTERIKATPPPILTTRHVSIGVKQAMIIMEAWAWLRNLHYSRHVQYIRLHPERLPCYEDLPVLSVMVMEHPSMYVVSSLDYLQYHAKINTDRRRPSPLEYHYALEYFKKYFAVSLDISDYEYSSDSEDEE